MESETFRRILPATLRVALAAGLAIGAALAIACSDDSSGDDNSVANNPSLPASTSLAGTTTTGGTPATSGTPRASAQPATVQITARDFAYDIPASIPGGLVKLDMRNTGAEPHHAQFARLNDGVTQQQLATALQAPDPSAALGLVALAGGPGVIQPGKSQVVYDDLKPGKYVLLCFVESDDGVPHAAKGMINFVDVTPATGTPAAAPAAQAQVTLADFQFTGGDTLPANRTTIEVTNAGPQPHEMALLKLDEGFTVDQLKAGLASDTPPPGPPPFEEVGGLQAIAPGTKGWAEVNLTAGNYAYICFVPDPATGQPHFALGMVKGFTVK